MCVCLYLWEKRHGLDEADDCVACRVRRGFEGHPGDVGGCLFGQDGAVRSAFPFLLRQRDVGCERGEQSRRVCRTAATLRGFFGAVVELEELHPFSMI